MSQVDGEKELVLGNKQLISLFFVVVALCGVFFAMGYIIGRNTSRLALANLDNNVAPAASPPEARSPESESKESEPPPETAAGTPAPADSQSTPAEGAPAQTSPSQTKPAQDTPAVPEAGATYLQVTALRRADADNLIKTLREQNFPALLVESSKPDLFRVLVGPYRQTADVADAKARLKALGFGNAFVQK